MELIAHLMAQASLPTLLTTAEFAEAQRLAAQTIRKNYCLQGHHHGVRPIKQASGKLLWRLEDLQNLLNGGAK